MCGKKRRRRLGGSEKCLVGNGNNGSLEVATSALPQRKEETRQICIQTKRNYPLVRNLEAGRGFVVTAALLQQLSLLL